MYNGTLLAYMHRAQEDMYLAIYHNNIINDSPTTNVP